MSLTVEQTKVRNQELINEVLEIYPEKTAKRRAKHLGTYEEGKPDCGVKSTIKSVPGVRSTICTSIGCVVGIIGRVAANSPSDSAPNTATCPAIDMPSPVRSARCITGRPDPRRRGQRDSAPRG